MKVVEDKVKQLEKRLQEKQLEKKQEQKNL